MTAMEHQQPPHTTPPAAVMPYAGDGTCRAHASPAPLTTPAGLQATTSLFWRRAIYFTASFVAWALLTVAVASVLSAGGWTVADAVFLFAAAIALPWPVMGFCNGLIGFWRLHVARNGIADAAPFLSAGDSAEALTTRTAVLMTLRNEDPARAMRRLRAVQTSLDATGDGAAFSYFVLSDSDRPDVVAAEAALVAQWRADSGLGDDRIVYRRRTSNDGFKAGNVHDFCDRLSDGYAFMLPLDADSLMAGSAVVRLVRIMEAYPRIGILQSLVVGTPSMSAFARIFQFGMRHGMRSYTLGQAWWTGDCGPYWGHNALVRIAPFRAHCRLPVLPGTPPLGGAILSHDQIEAVLMRRAGFEVRVMPVEDGSYEDNPPDSIAFMQRDLRWCQGNMQYTTLLRQADVLSGIEPVSRYQVVWAILMFLTVPAWTMAMIALPFIAADAASIADFPVALAAGLYVFYLALTISPKLFSIVSALISPGEVARFGGAWRYMTSIVIETVVGFLHGAGGAIRTTLFILSLPFGGSLSWNGQNRDARGVTWRAAFSAYWPALVFGVGFHGALLAVAPSLVPWVSPLTAGYVLAIPLCVVLASPRVGAFFKRNRLAGIPEDFTEPAIISAVAATARVS